MLEALVVMGIVILMYYIGKTKAMLDFRKAAQQQTKQKDIQKLEKELQTILSQLKSQSNGKTQPEKEEETEAKKKVREMKEKFAAVLDEL